MELVSKDPTSAEYILPVHRDDYNLLTGIKLGQILARSVNTSEYGVMKDFSLMMLKALETVNEMPLSVLFLSEGQLL